MVKCSFRWLVALQHKHVFNLFINCCFLCLDISPNSLDTHSYSYYSVVLVDAFGQSSPHRLTQKGKIREIINWVSFKTYMWSNINVKQTGNLCFVSGKSVESIISFKPLFLQLLAEDRL